jgi:hypothetical protein
MSEIHHDRRYVLIPIRNYIEKFIDTGDQWYQDEETTQNMRNFQFSCRHSGCPHVIFAHQSRAANAASCSDCRNHYENVPPASLSLISEEQKVFFRSINLRLRVI